MRPVNREILRLAWPAIATNVTTPLLSLADIAIAGHIGVSVAIGAVAVGGTMINILYWVFAFLRMGTSGLTARAYGAADIAGIRLVFRRGLTIAVAGGVALWLVSSVAGSAVLALIDADDSVQPLAADYFAIVIAGAPAVLTSFVVSGWLLGMQRSRPILWIALTTNLLNIALSATLVFGLGLGLRGVAVGTAVAQWTGAAVGLLTVRRYYPGAAARGVPSTVGGYGRFFKLNADIFLRTACLAAVTLWFTRAGAAMGAHVLAANALLMQLFLLFSYFMDGFAFAGEALAGKFDGAADADGLAACVRGLFRWGAAMAGACAALYFVGGEWLLSLLTDDRHVVDVAADYLPWAVTVPLAGFAAFTWDGIFVGLTRSRWLLWSMASAMAVFFALYFALRGAMGNHALWLAFTAYLGVRGLVARALYRRLRPVRKRQ